MRLKQDRKHPRAHIRDERLRHEAKMLRLAQIYGISEPFLTPWLKRATDRKPCSCDMCGNPRRHWKQKPISELRLELMEAQDDV